MKRTKNKTKFLKDGTIQRWNPTANNGRGGWRPKRETRCGSVYYKPGSSIHN